MSRFQYFIRRTRLFATKGLIFSGIYLALTRVLLSTLTRSYLPMLLWLDYFYALLALCLFPIVRSLLFLERHQFGSFHHSACFFGFRVVIPRYPVPLTWRYYWDLHWSEECSSLFCGEPTPGIRRPSLTHCQILCVFPDFRVKTPHSTPDFYLSDHYHVSIRLFCTQMFYFAHSTTTYPPRPY